MSAELEVRNVIVIGARGAVLIGYVRQGYPAIGQLTSPVTLGAGPARQLEVIAVERLSSMEAGGEAVGLVFRQPPPLPQLRQAFPPGARLKLDLPTSA